MENALPYDKTLKKPARQNGEFMNRIHPNQDKNKTGAQQNSAPQKNPAPIPTGFARGVPILLLALAVFLTLCFMTQSTGVIGRFISDVLLGLFSYAAYALPLLIALHGIFYYSDLHQKRRLSRFIFSAVAVVGISALIYIFKYWGQDLAFTFGKYYTDGKNGAGLIGSTVAFLLMKVIGPVGVIILTVAFFALYVVYFFGRGRSSFVILGLKLLTAVLSFFSKIEEKILRLGSRGKKAKENKKSKAMTRVGTALSEDDFFTVDNGISELAIPELDIHEVKSRRALEENPTLQESIYPSRDRKENAQRDFRAAETAKEAGTPLNSDLRAPNKNGSADTFIYDAHFEDRRSPRAEEAKTYASNNESAEAVFTKDFDPFNIALNTKLANKKSSHANKMESTGFRTEEDEIPTSPAEIEKRLREMEFEKKKQQILAQRQKQEQERREQFEAARAAARADAYTATATAQQSRAYEATTNVQDSKILQKTDTENVCHFATEPQVTYIADTDPYTSQTEDDRPDTSDLRDTPAATVTEFHTAREEQEGQVQGFQSFEPIISTPPQAPAAPAALQVERETLSLRADDLSDIEEDDGEPAPIPPEEQNPQVMEYRNHFAFLREEPNETLYAEGVREMDASLTDAEEEQDEADIPPFDDATNVSNAFNSFRKRDTEIAESINAKALRPNYSDYKLPSLDLLAKGAEEADDGILAEIQERQERLMDALAAYNINASIREVDRGPRITRYAVVPGKGVKSSTITSREEDISLALSAKGMRVESIPEKGAIGFEIPNNKPQTVRLRDLIESEAFLSAESKTTVCFGKDVTGKPVFGDIAKMLHMLVAGATGMGKSVCINAILISMLYKARPDEVKFILIDPKKVEFNVYNGIPHLLVPVVTDPKQAAGALMWAVEQMEKRYDQIQALCVRNIEAYNAKVKEDPSLGEPMPKIIIVIDELNDLMIQVRDPVENLIMSIAQKARAAGIHLIIGTQRPSVNVITGVIKANVPTRISCKVSSAIDSRTILERSGAEKLLNNGDMLFHPVGAPDPIRVQGAFVTDKEVEMITDFLKKQSKGASYDEQAIEDINRAAKKCAKKSSSGREDSGEDYESDGILNDPKFLDAVDIAIKNQKIATSLLQRKLSIGYSKAASYIDAMEGFSIVSGANGSKPRDVLMTMDEWHEMLARRSLD